jgi:hypothetical protein
VSCSENGGRNIISFGSVMADIVRWVRNSESLDCNLKFLSLVVLLGCMWFLVAAFEIDNSVSTTRSIMCPTALSVWPWIFQYR